MAIPVLVGIGVFCAMLFAAFTAQIRDPNASRALAAVLGALGVLALIALFAGIVVTVGMNRLN